MTVLPGATFVDLGERPFYAGLDEEKLIAASRAHYAEAQRRMRNSESREWNAAHRDRMREASRRWNAAHPGVHYARVLAWRVANPERRREQNRRWYARRKAREHGIETVRPLREGSSDE